jgi:hypothetical protein
MNNLTYIVGHTIKQMAWKLKRAGEKTPNNQIQQWLHPEIGEEKPIKDIIRQR